MIGIYFSGTGNTRYCVETFLKSIEKQANAYPVESADAKRAIIKQDTIVFGYPVYYSNIPKIVRDFIDHNANELKNKNIFIIATMGLFSGDGTGCSARLLKKYRANVIGGLHLRMPDCIGDERVLKKSIQQNRNIVRAADRKIQWAVQQYKNGTPVQEGLNIFYHVAGLFGQRLWFYNKTKQYTDKCKVNDEKCIGCGRCVTICPMDNLALISNRIISKSKCTLCYRCFSECPKQAINILGKTVYEQPRLEKYL